MSWGKALAGLGGGLTQFGTGQIKGWEYEDIRRDKERQLSQTDERLRQGREQLEATKEYRDALKAFNGDKLAMQKYMNGMSTVDMFLKNKQWDQAIGLFNQLQDEAGQPFKIEPGSLKETADGGFEYSTAGGSLFRHDAQGNVKEYPSNYARAKADKARAGGKERTYSQKAKDWEALEEAYTSTGDDFWEDYKIRKGNIRTIFAKIFGADLEDLGFDAIGYIESERKKGTPFETVKKNLEEAVRTGRPPGSKAKEYDFDPNKGMIPR